MPNKSYYPTAGTIPTESQEQRAVMQWAEVCKGMCPELALLVHIPNGGLRDPIVAVKLKREGVKKGFPDLFLPVPRGQYHGLMIELKRVKGGVVKPEQKQWLDHLNAQGYRAVVCKGADEAIKEIENYLRGK